MVRISGNENAREVKSVSSSDYEKQMESLSKKIKPQAESMEDLENAKKIKKQQIALAERNGDTTTAASLKKDLRAIEQDIKRNTSIFS